MAFMSNADVQHRPAKRRRFFVDEPEDVADRTASPTETGSWSSRPQSAEESSSSANKPHERNQTDASEVAAHNTNGTTHDFDHVTFSAFVGEDVAPETLRKVREAAGDNMERAINMYLDGSWKKATIAILRDHETISASSSGVDQCTPIAETVTEKRETATKVPASTASPALKSISKDRYIGSFGVNAWSTKSGANLIKHGDGIKVERTKISPKTKLGRGGKVVQMVGRNQKADIITRFTNSKGEELGRLPEETAKWVSTLLDQKVCRFEGTCVYAPGRLRVNDTICLQLRCFMLRSAFEARGFANLKDDNRATGIFEEKESIEEKDLRLRQVALVTMFDEIHLHPTATNETTSQHKKQGILRAAEMAEQYERDKSSGVKTNGNATPTEDEEEGVELEEDQLDALYKKAQSFDFDTPEAEPPETFILELRKYQKQALHWMLSKERDQKSDREASMHPLWEEYSWPTKDADDNSLPQVEKQDKFYVNLYSGEVGLEFPVQKQNCLGGILADEMGLGKTIEMFSLIHSHPSEMVRNSGDKTIPSVNSLPRLPRLLLLWSRLRAPHSSSHRCRFLPNGRAKLSKLPSRAP